MKKIKNLSTGIILISLLLPLSSCLSGKEEPVETEIAPENVLDKTNPEKLREQGIDPNNQKSAPN
jgi:hypothetical protein